MEGLILPPGVPHGYRTLQGTEMDFLLKQKKVNMVGLLRRPFPSEFQGLIAVIGGSIVPMFAMLSRVAELLPLTADDVPGIACVLAGMVAALVVMSRLSKRTDLSAFPTVGLTVWPGSWTLNGTRAMQEGYVKYKSVPFKILDGFRWVIILSNRDHLEEVRKAPEDILSFHEVGSDLLKVKYTMGPELYQNAYHSEAIRSQLTRNLASLYDDIRDEICVAFGDVLDLEDHEWKSVPALNAIQQVVCRTSNRVFIGLPLCRDPDWVDLNIRFTLDVAFGAYMLKLLFPDFLAPLVVRFMTSIPGSVKRGMKLLGPIIEERLRHLEEYGKDWTDKPNDTLSWLLDLAPEGPERTVRLLTLRLLSINFAAIHTSSISFTHALFYLAANPHYIQPLREEVESIVKKEGWSKTSVGKMHKIDSFLKECQRLEGVTTASLTRKVMKDFTFSDGTFIPKGTLVTAPSRELHLDNEFYPDAHDFNPFRFSDKHGEDNEGTGHQYASTSPEYLAFGHGRHACPGRFFAASELKTMLAHVVVSYDVKLEDGKARPRKLLYGAAIIADPATKVMFRKRAC